MEPTHAGTSTTLPWLGGCTLRVSGGSLANDKLSWSGSRGSFVGFEEVECGGPSGIRTRVSVLRGRAHGS